MPAPPPSFMKVYDPKRAAYRKKSHQVAGCEFCHFENIQEQECRSLSGDFWWVVVNKYPYMDGNLMMISKRHIEDMGDLSQEEQREFFDVLEKTKRKLQEIFRTTSFNIGINIGKFSGASIKHMHWQIIPRQKKIQNATNIFGDIHVMTVSPMDLRKVIDGK